MASGLFGEFFFSCFSLLLIFPHKLTYFGLLLEVFSRKSLKTDLRFFLLKYSTNIESDIQLWKHKINFSLPIIMASIIIMVITTMITITMREMGVVQRVWQCTACAVHLKFPQRRRRNPGNYTTEANSRVNFFLSNISLIFPFHHSAQI